MRFCSVHPGNPGCVFVPHIRGEVGGEGFIRGGGAWPIYVHW